MAPWKATNDERRLDNKTEWAANCPWRRANTALYAAMAEYHKAPKQVSNDWTPRPRLGKPQLFARLRLATTAHVFHMSRKSSVSAAATHHWNRSRGPVARSSAAGSRERAGRTAPAAGTRAAEGRQMRL